MFFLSFFTPSLCNSVFCRHLISDVWASWKSNITSPPISSKFFPTLAPNPGSAGVVERASLSMMAEIVPPGFEPNCNFLWRFSTVYIGAIVGLLLIVYSVVRDTKEIYGRQQKRTGFPTACYFRQNRNW
jgi:hypothetical protein